MKIKNILVASLAIIGYTYAWPEADRVKKIAQMTDISFGLFSGFVPINGTKKQLHYVTALSQKDPLYDPVLFWFNGGPGCSSMLGFLQEHGPYVLEDGALNLTKNDYSWNKEATMIYLESPAGVGFSYCPDQSECHFDDHNSADDNLVAVLNVMQMKFPELQKNDLYITGESYAGIYVPQLVYRMDKYIQNNTGKEGVYIPNLKGFAVGNGVTNWKYDGDPVWFNMSYWFGLIDQQLYDNVNQNCNLSYWDFTYDNFTKQCKDWLSHRDDLVDNINPYDVFGKCWTSNQTSIDKSKFTASDYTPFSSFAKKKGNLKHHLHCTYAMPVYYYLNQPDVRASLNIPEYIQEWDFCVDNFNYTRIIDGTQWIYDELLTRSPELGLNKYRILKYSGDADGVIPTIGTRMWIDELNWKINNPWREWHFDGQVAGYLENRVDNQFMFASVHGAGHMVPQWRRPQGYHLMFSFIKNKNP